MKRSSSRSRTPNCCLTCTRWNPAEPRTRPRSSTATSCSTRAIGSGKQPLALSAREYTTLETLIRANGEFLSFDELLEKVCGTGIFEQRDIMDGTLYSLTRKMRRMGFFITQRGHRYRIR